MSALRALSIERAAIVGGNVPIDGAIMQTVH